MNNKKILLLILCGVGLALLSACAALGQARWDEQELSKLKGLWIKNLSPLKPNPSNAYADNVEAARLGQKLFFDTRFSSNGKVACSTCHLPDLLFQDGIPLAHGVGTTTRRTMTIIGTAYSPWLFWDGRKDSLWAQALGPLENPVEHGGSRTLYARLIQQHYRDDYETIFGQMPDLSRLPESAGPLDDPTAKAAWEAMTEADRQNVTQVYVNIGKAIEAYERLLLPGESRFDRYVEAVMQNDNRSANEILTSNEIAGLRLFIGEANCIDCHNGPLFTNNDFHNTGVPVGSDTVADAGRASGVQQVLADEFNCLSTYSDADPEQCAELNYLITDDHEFVRQFKPPSLRNVANRGPYMHAGQFATLEEVVKHYNTAPAAPDGHTELEPLGLTEQQLEQLVAFLKTLDSPVKADPTWLSAPIMQSGVR